MISLSLLAAQGLSVVEASRGYSVVVVHGLLTVMTSLIVEQGSRTCELRSCSSQALEHKVDLWCLGLIFPQHVRSSQIRSNPCLLHWQVDF